MEETTNVHIGVLRKMTWKTNCLTPTILDSTQQLNEPAGSGDFTSIVYDIALQLVWFILAIGPKQSSLNRNPQPGEGRKIDSLIPISTHFVSQGFASFLITVVYPEKKHRNPTP